MQQSAADETPIKPDYSGAHAPELFPECEVSAQMWEAFPPLDSVDIWGRIRVGFQLPHTDNKRIANERNWYARHPDYLRRVTERGLPYIYHIVDQVETRNMPTEIALLPIVESAFDPFAYSHGRASGMWQIIPGTGKMLGLKQNWWYDGRRDVLASTDAALNYLEQLHQQFDGDWLLALAAYNSGAGNVSRAIAKNQQRNRPTDFWSLDLPKETKAYVPRLLALGQLFDQPEKYNLAFHPVMNQPYFAPVTVGSQIDLAEAAALAEIDMDMLYLLNPGFNRWATDPKGPHTLLIPIDKAFGFEEKLKSVPNTNRITWDRYVIRNGDTLNGIAAKYNISVDTLKSINQLRGTIIRAGSTLLVPIAARESQHYTFSASERLHKTIAAADQKQSGKRVEYVVQQGDTFWSIGRRFNVHAQKIAQWNNMAPRDPIHPGQKLVLWTASPEVAAVDTDGAGIVRKVSYIVRKGDSLARIADKFSVQITDILQWNRVSKSNYLQPGQSLTLFVDVTNM